MKSPCEARLRSTRRAPRVGVVNGLSVFSAGDVEFGQPMRITAVVGIGREGIIDVEREAQLGGSIHTKGVAILRGYLARMFGQERPLSLRAQLAFEQSYGEIDGDSASSSELFAVLSALADVGIDQGIAVTGSVNQLGEMQAIGGVCAKIEGFFDLCKARGLTGTQGVLIPRANRPHLVLRDDAAEAIARGQFHLYAVDVAAQGIEVLTGLPAGERDASGRFPASSVFGRVERRIIEIAEKLRQAEGHMLAEAAEAMEEGGGRGRYGRWQCPRQEVKRGARSGLRALEGGRRAASAGWHSVQPSSRRRSAQARASEHRSSSALTEVTSFKDASIRPDAYSAFLRGAIAEASGHSKDAVIAYEQAARLDPESGETWTRVGEVRCRENVRDHAAEEAFARALVINPKDARAWAAKARRAVAQGDGAVARAAAGRAADLDPSADGANALLARGGVLSDASTREALVALTVSARDPAVAWGCARRMGRSTRRRCSLGTGTEGARQGGARTA